MRIQSNRSEQNGQSNQNNQNNQNDQSNTQYLQHAQLFNEGYSKACFEIGFSQGYNSGYQAGLNQGYWNSQTQTTDACVGSEFNFLPQTEQNKQYDQCEPGNSMENVFDNNMEIDFKWCPQDNNSETHHTPLYDTSTTGYVVKADVVQDDLRQDVDVNNIFNSHEPISWNVIKEEPKLEENSPFLFDNKCMEDPFGDYKLDSHIFSNFSWDDILTQNTDTPLSEYKYEQEPITIKSRPTTSTPPNSPIFEYYSTFPIIQEDYDENEEDIEENEKDDDNSWVYVTETKEDKDDSTDLDSYSLNFDSFTSDYSKIQSKTCDEISLDSSISSESIAENDVGVLSYSMSSLPSLQYSFDDRNELTYYDEMYYNPTCKLPGVYP
jgi:hypothetical protein